MFGSNQSFPPSPLRLELHDSSPAQGEALGLDLIAARAPAVFASANRTKAGRPL